MPDVKMFMDDPEQRALLGVPHGGRKVHNPFYEATELEKAGQRREAERIYLELLNLHFDNGALQAALGMNYAQVEKNGLAHALLQRALTRVEHMVEDFKQLGIIPKGDSPGAMIQFLMVKRAEILNALGTCYKHENRIPEARSYFDEADKLTPNNPDILNNMGTLYINEGKPKMAHQLLTRALQNDPDHAQAHWNRSLAHLELGEYLDGWPEYDWGLKASVRVERNYTIEPLPIWDGSPGKTVVVYGEQGIGDEIMFASVLPDMLKDCKQVVFECHKKLHTLFANSFPGIDIYPTREDPTLTWPVKLDGSPRYAFDAKIAIGSIPRLYRSRLEDFPGTPYLTPTAGSELRWNEKLATLGAGPKVGIHWLGGHKKTRIDVRSLALEKLLPILEQKGIHWISLQYTDAQEEELNEFHQRHPDIQIHHWPEAVYSPNYDDTAGLVANLDLVITVCTSVVHLSGALGVPAWVLTPSRPAWRYRLDLDYMPWYGKTVTLFRQAEGSTDWHPVIEEVATNLEAMMSIWAGK